MNDPELCNHLNPMTEPLKIRCDRKPKHTGKHRNREHGMEWWNTKESKP